MIRMTILRANGELVELEFPSWNRVWKIYKRLRKTECLISLC